MGPVLDPPYDLFWRSHLSGRVVPGRHVAREGDARPEPARCGRGGARGRPEEAQSAWLARDAQEEGRDSQGDGAEGPREEVREGRRAPQVRAVGPRGRAGEFGSCGGESSFVLNQAKIEGVLINLLTFGCRASRLPCCVPPLARICIGPSLPHPCANNSLLVNQIHRDSPKASRTSRRSSPGRSPPSTPLLGLREGSQSTLGPAHLGSLGPACSRIGIPVF